MLAMRDARCAEGLGPRAENRKPKTENRKPRWYFPPRPFPTQMSDPTVTAPLDAESLSASLTVRDVHASLAWYRDALGFAVDREMQNEGKLRAVAMRAGSVRLLLNQDDGAKGLDRAKGEGFSLMLTTRQDVDAVAARVVAHGGQLLSEPADMPWGMRVFRVRDPDGFAFAVASPTE